jgi:hypothetical protein
MRRTTFRSSGDRAEYRQSPKRCSRGTAVVHYLRGIGEIVKVGALHRSPRGTLRAEISHYKQHRTKRIWEESGGITQI